MNRLYPGRTSIGVGQAYGRSAYGRIGFGAQAAASNPRYVTPFLEEYTEPIEALVTAPYGTFAYGSWWVRQAQVAVQIDEFTMWDDRTSSTEFVEDETIMPVIMRIHSDGRLRAYELIEVD